MMSMTPQPGERIGYDELLAARVVQLREIDERLEAIYRKAILYDVTGEIRRLRNDIADMIRRAEAESAAF